jgi:hypothetical protein
MESPHSFEVSLTIYKITLRHFSLRYNEQGVHAWLIRRVVEWMIGFIHTLYMNSGLQASIALQLFPIYTCTRVNWPRIYSSLLVTSNDTWSFLILFLPLFCNCQHNPIPLVPSSYPGRLASPCSTLLDSALFSTASASLGTLLYNHFVRTTRKTSIKESCLMIRCLVMCNYMPHCILLFLVCIIVCLLYWVRIIVCLRFILLYYLRFIVLCLLFIVLCTYYFMFVFYCIVLYYCIVLLYRFCLY